MSGNSSGGNSSGGNSGGRISWGALLGAGVVAFLFAAAKGEAPIPDTKPDPNFSVPYFDLNSGAAPTTPSAAGAVTPAAPACSVDAVAAKIAAAGFPTIAAAQAAHGVPVSGVIDSDTVTAVGC